MNGNTRNLACAVLAAVLVAGCAGGAGKAGDPWEGYEGEVNADAEPHGQGVLAWPNGRRYEGEWRDGQPHGQGVLTRPDGTHFEGAIEFLPGGNMVMSQPGGTRLVGATGDGTIVLMGSDGTRYTGETRATASRTGKAS